MRKNKVDKAMPDRQYKNMASIKLPAILIISAIVISVFYMMDLLIYSKAEINVEKIKNDLSKAGFVVDLEDMVLSENVEPLCEKNGRNYFDSACFLINYGGSNIVEPLSFDNFEGYETRFDLNSINFKNRSATEYILKMEHILRLVEEGNSKDCFVSENLYQPVNCEKVLKIQQLFFVKALCYINSNDFPNAEKTIIESIRFALNLCRNDFLSSRVTTSERKLVNNALLYPCKLINIFLQKKGVISPELQDECLAVCRFDSRENLMRSCEMNLAFSFLLLELEKQKDQKILINNGYYFQINDRSSYGTVKDSSYAEFFKNAKENSLIERSDIYDMIKSNSSALYNTALFNERAAREESFVINSFYKKFLEEDE